MSDRFDELEAKISKMIEMIGELRQENRRTKDENKTLRAELDGARQQVEQLKLRQNDQTETVKTKLSSILERIEELERMGS